VRFFRPVAVIIVAAAALAGGALPLSAAPDAEAAKQFIRDGIARTIELLKRKNMPRRQIEARLRAELRAGFDVPTIAGYVLGPLRRGITEDQKRRYLHAFEELIVQTYTNRVFNVQPRIETISPDIIRVTGATPVGADQLMVHSQVNRSGATWVKIDWRLRQRDRQLLIIDIVILGISQAEVYRSEFASVARRNGGGVEGLIRALTEKNAELRGK